MKKTLFVVISCLLTPTLLNAQKKDSIVESLKLQIKQADSDSLRVQLRYNLIKNMGQTFDDRKREYALLVTEDILDIIENKELNTPHFQRIKAESLQDMATLSLDTRNWADALEWQQKAIDYSKENKFTLIEGIGYWGLAAVQCRQRDTVLCIRNMRKSITILKGVDSDEARPFHAQSLFGLGNILLEQKKLDSTRLLYRQAIAQDKAGIFKAALKQNIARTYSFEKKYDKAIEGFKETLTYRAVNDLIGKSSDFKNIAISYRFLEDYKNALTAIDSAIFYASITRDVPVPHRMKVLLGWKKLMLYKAGRYKEAYDNYVVYEKYKDTLVNVEEEKRLVELDLNYTFEKEKELANSALAAESSKKRLYFILFFVVLGLGLLTIYFILKNKKQKESLAKNQIELKENELKLQQLEKLKADLALSNRENELKKVVLENSITEEVLNKTLDDIKEVITLSDAQERQRGLKSISASLLSKKASQKPISTLKEYIDTVEMDFKVHLDTFFKDFKPKEKELLYLMKAGLTTSEISKVSNASISAVKSTRYRIRKKLGLDSSADIIAHLEASLSRS